MRQKNKQTTTTHVAAQVCLEAHTSPTRCSLFRLGTLTRSACHACAAFAGRLRALSPSAAENLVRHLLLLLLRASRCCRRQLSPPAVAAAVPPQASVAASVITVPASRQSRRRRHHRRCRHRPCLVCCGLYCRHGSLPLASPPAAAFCPRRLPAAVMLGAALCISVCFCVR